LKTSIKPFVVILFIALAAPSLAQDFVKPGTIELGGTLLVSHQTKTYDNPQYSGYEMFNLKFDPYIGLMLSKGFSLGIIPGVSYQKSNIFYVGSEHNAVTLLSFYLSPEYNFNVKGNIYPFVAAQIGYHYYLDAPYKMKGLEGLDAGLGLGMKLQIGNNGLAVFQALYLSQRFNYDYPSYSNQMTVSFFAGDYAVRTFSFGVGYRIFLVKKEKKE
jgi:hypothetical protein